MHSRCVGNSRRTYIIQNLSKYFNKHLRSSKEKKQRIDICYARLNIYYHARARDKRNARARVGYDKPRAYNKI